MKPPLYHILLEPDESFTCRTWRRPSREINTLPVYFSEYLLMLNSCGQGMRYIGDNVERYQKNDLVIVGPNLPHAFVSDDLLMCDSVSATFRENLLGADLMALPEMTDVRNLLALARRGVAFPAAVSRQVTPDMIRMSQAKRGERLCLLVNILNHLATAPGIRPLASKGFSLALNDQDASRLATVCRYIQQSYQEKIQRQAAAKLAGLSPGAFSHFFHRRMGKTFEDYVKEVRIGQVCRKLLEQDATVAEIAFAAGFNNLSNFNRHFLAIKGITPRKYRLLHQEE